MPNPEAEIIKDTRLYEVSLRDLALRADQIVKAMPEDPGELAKNFRNMHGILMEARTNLLAILDRKKEINSEAATVLQSAAGVRQSFFDLAKRIDVSIEELRRKTTDNPQAVESAVHALEGVKETCQKGDMAVTPLRDLVIRTHREAQGIFAELEAYPQIYEYAIEAADLYEKGLGEPASYANVIQGLYKARENLRSIISAFTEAASKAEEAIKKLPNVPASGSPVS